MSSSDQLAVLPVAERNELERFLMKFDQEWSPESLLNFWGRLSPDKTNEYLHSAASELVKIDLRRGWAASRGRLLEDYCERIPVLGDADTIDVGLILAEYDARRAVDPNVTKESYEGRFPHQFQHFAKLVDRIVDSSGVRAGPQPSQASLDTSRISRARDTNFSGITSPIQLPVEFGRYRLVKELGAGAMGMVYLAHDTQLDRQVALKTPTFKRDKQEELVSRFYREARSAAKIHHRNICPIYDVGEIDGQHFISMGFVRGRRLAEYISPDKLPPAKTSAVLVHRLTLALAEAHRHNIVHRDLKPANIMIDVKREPVVLDFGLARDTESETRMTKSGMIVGTPAYMSPEQIRGDSTEVGPGSDIYALGVVLYELLTGRLPFEGSVTQVIYKVTSEAPRPPSEIRSEVPPELEAICLNMMAKRPEDRYESMDEAARDLKRFLKGKQPAALEAAAAEFTGTPSPDRAEESSESEAGNIGETGVLNAFFAAQAAGDPRQTSVEPSVRSARREALSLSSTPLKAIRRRIGRPPVWTKWTAAALAPVMLLAALAMTFRVGDKQVRLEIGQQLAESEGLEVFLDGNQLSIAGLGKTIELDVGEHQWEIRRGEQVIQGPKRYVVNRGENEVLRIEVEDMPAAGGTGSGSEEASGPEEVANDDASEKKTSEPPAKTTVARTPLPEGESVSDRGTEWIELFNGNDLSGWKINDDPATWSVENGRLVAEGEGHGYLLTEDSFDDFELKLEYRITRGANSGVFLRAPLELSKRPGVPGREVEFAIVDNDGLSKQQRENALEQHGAIYGLSSPGADAAAPPGDWNQLIIRAAGPRLRVTLNDHEIHDVDLDPLAMQNPDHTGLQRESGHIALQHRKSQRVEFRNIRIRPLRSGAASSTAAASETDAASPITSAQPIMGNASPPRDTIALEEQSGERSSVKRSSSSPAQTALHFDGENDYLVAENCVFDGSHPLTLEAVVDLQPEGQWEHAMSVFSSMAGKKSPGVRLAVNKGWWAIQSSNGSWRKSRGGRGPKSGKMHLAAVWHEEMRFFIDGRPFRFGAGGGGGGGGSGSLNRRQPLLPIVFGADPTIDGKTEAHFRGNLYQLRISNNARYTDAFEPQEPLQSDGSTVALYRVDEASGNRLEDISGSGNHGKVVGATWISSAGRPANQDDSDSLQR